MCRHAGCGLLQTCLDELAGKYPSTKFLRIVSTDAIPNYPDANLPTLLVYNDTKCLQVRRAARVCVWGGGGGNRGRTASMLHGGMCMYGNSV